MGGSGGKAEVNKYTSLSSITIIPSGITDFDKIALLFQDVAQQAEELRYKVVNGRDVLTRISKVHTLKDHTLTDAYKVWLWSVGGCNYGQLQSVQFKADWEDYDAAKKIPQEEEPKDIADQVVSGFKAGFGAFMSAAKSVVAKVEEKIDDLVGNAPAPPEEPRIVQANLGICGDYKLQAWPKTLATYIVAVRVANQVAPLMLERMKFLVEKGKELKNKVSEILGSLEGATTTDKMIMVAKVGSSLVQFGMGLKVLEQMCEYVPKYYQEIQDLLDNYQNIYDSSYDHAQKVYQNIGIRPFFDNEGSQVLRKKIQFVSQMLDGKKFDDELLKQVAEQKVSRKDRRPRAKGNQKFYDVLGKEDVFPVRFRWIDSQFFDTHFSAISIGLSELEYARSLGGDARKKMIKMTGVGNFTDKSVSSCFEVWTWACSISRGGKLAELELTLSEEAPWIRGKDIEKVKFDDKAEQFRAKLNIFLDYFSPKRSQRLADYWTEYSTRWGVIEKEKFTILERTKNLSGPDVYNAISSMSKNLLCLDIYYKRSSPIYYDVIQKYGYEGQYLYQRYPIILQESDTLGALCKGTDMSKMAEKHVQGRLAPEVDLEQRKKKNQELKKKRTSRKWLWKKEDEN